MCFSAQASFFAAALLTCTWIACLLKTTKHTLFLPFIPFFFAVQQFTEGLLWVLIPRGGPTTVITAGTYIFLFIAVLGWPLLIPLAGRALEQVPQKKTIFNLFIALAFAWIAVGGYQLVAYGADATIDQSHILYTLYSPIFLKNTALYYYLGATLLPFFIGSNRYFNALGILTALSCIAAYYVWYAHFLSVWCFFAALISAMTYLIVASLAQEKHL